MGITWIGATWEIVVVGVFVARIIPSLYSCRHVMSRRLSGVSFYAVYVQFGHLRVFKMVPKNQRKTLTMDGL